MPSRYTAPKQATAWLYAEGGPLSSTARTSRAFSRGSVREMSSQILRLADRLRVDPDELAESIPADTIRRTKYPVIETVNDDGSRTFFNPDEE